MPSRTFLVVCSCFIVARVASGQPASTTCSARVPLGGPNVSSATTSSGATIGILDSAALSSLAGRTLSEALAARIPGVSVLRSSGVAGTGSRIYIRGANGILVRQQPLLYIDGVRADGQLQSLMLDVGGQAPSRIDDIPLDQVDCVYVLRGPAAAAPYGTDASGGVIHVITRGAAHAYARDEPRVTAYVDGGATTDVASYPANFGTSTGCTRARAALGQCAVGTVQSWSPMDADSPFRAGLLTQGGARWSVLTGGRLSASLAASGTVENGALRNNEHQRYAVAASAAFTPTRAFTLQPRGWALGGATRLPYVGGFQVSVLNSALAGNSVDDSVRRGYRQFPRSVLQQFFVDQHVRRLGGSLDAAWKPARWLAVSAVAGREDSRAEDENLPPDARTLAGGTIFVGPPVFKATGELRNQYTSASATIVSTFGPAAFRSSTSVGGQYVTETSRAQTRSILLADGTQLTSSWSAHDAKSRGVVARETVNSSERRFLEVGVRRDVVDRTFGRFADPTYVFGNGAWHVDRESFFPANPVVSSLRLRAAFGQGGDARSYDIAFGTASDGGLRAPVVGTEEPPVERTRETEGGLDIGVFHDRVAVQATRYVKRTTDALYESLFAPGAGGGISVPVVNLASWETRGTEVAAQIRLVDGRALRADVAVSYSTLDNEVIALGGAPPLSRVTSRVVEGFPLFGLWARPYVVTDANGDGVIVPAEIISGTQDRFRGSATPTRELGVAPNVRLGPVTLAALVDYRGGFYRYDQTGSFRCNARCAALYVPGASLDDQARAVDANRTIMGWIEDASFIRLRELSLAWTAPSLGRLVGARSAAVTVAGRNIATWTDYAGLDPEGALGGQTDLEGRDFFTLPLPRTVSLRLDLRW
jgi:outer membrane receptor protein involved in Fe transport